MDTLEQTELKSLVLDIIEVEFPHEIQNFVPYSDLFITNALNDPDFLKDKGVNAHYEFDASSAESIISCISLLMGIVRTYKEVKKISAKKKSQQELMSELRTNLIAAGMNEEKASEIIKNHSAKLSNLTS